jgi:5'-methylthioadenosine phosphorylase
MTQYPEVHLVRELEMSSINISLITDYDTGVEGIPPVSHEAVLEVFQANNDKLRQLLFRLIELMPKDTIASGATGVLASSRIC